MNKGFSFLPLTIVMFCAVPLVHAQEITLFDYEEATSAFEEAYFNGNLNVSKDRDAEDTSYDFNASVDYERVFSSPARDISIKADASGFARRSEDTDITTTVTDNVTGETTTRRETSDGDADGYAAELGLTVDTYFHPGSNGAFWFGDLNLKADDDFDDVATSLTAGIGYGRVVVVTPMAKAIRIVEELARVRVLRSRPTRSVYQQIASIINRENEYRSRYGSRDYQQRWISDIEGVLKSSGTVSSLGATGILEVRDILIDERISERRYGWKIRAGLGYQGTNFSGIDDSPLLRLQGEYHRPLSNQTQFSNVATLSSTLNNDDNSYTFDNDMTLTYEIDDRIDWENSWDLTYVSSDTDANDFDVTTNVLESTFIYELNNVLDFTTTFRVDDTDGSKNDDGTDRSLNMGLRYRLR